MDKKNFSPFGGFFRHISAANWWDELRVALAMLTRLSWIRPSQVDLGTGRRAVAWFPFIGAVLGIVGGVVDSIGGYCGLPPIVTAPLAFGAMIWATGALHEGGLANFADGCCGGTDAASKLAIMRDSRIGTFGTLTLILTLIIRVGAMASLGTSLLVFATLITAGALSRAVMPPVAAWLGPVRTDDAAAGVALVPPSGVRLVVGLVVAIIIDFVVNDPVTAGLLLGAALLSALFVARFAQQQIGGYTRDVRSTVQQVAEAAILVVAVAAQQ